MRPIMITRRIGFPLCLLGLTSCLSFGPPPVPPGTVSQVFPHSVQRSPSVGHASQPPARKRTAPDRHGPKSQSGEAFKQPEPLEVPPSDAPSELDGPKFEPPQADASPQLQLGIDVPARRQLGSNLLFTLLVHNTGEATAENVRLVCDFDEALIFPGHPEKRVRRDLGRLRPGEAHDVQLKLTSETLGQHCCRFSLMAGDREAVWKSVCVEFVPRSLELSVIGPHERTVGSRAEFTVSLKNSSPNELRDVHVMWAYDSKLRPHEASVGAEQNPGLLSWDLGTVEPGRGVQLQAEFDCPTVTESACCMIEASARDIPAEQLQKCLTVVPRQDFLAVEVRDRVDPVRVGEETYYIVTVTNQGRQLARSIELRAELSGQFSLEAVEVQHNRRRIPPTVQIQNRLVSIAPVAHLAPGGVLTYSIRAKAVSPGAAKFAARIGRAAGRAPIEVQEITTVNP